MFRFLTFLIFIILIQRLFKSLQEQQKEPQEPTEDEIGNYFKNLGFPATEEIPPKPERLEKPKQPDVAKKEIKRQNIKIAEPEPAGSEYRVEPTQAIKEELPVFSEDKLEEGIILSEILGPPKACQSCRGGGIGIRAGLKNQ